MRVAVTGGATGIGAAVIAQLKKAGHHVTVYDITKPDGDADQWIHTDLSDADSIAAAIAQSPTPFDALINNAGLPPRDGAEENILRVNYFGLVAFMNGMLSRLQRGSSIVNTASRAGAMWQTNLAEVKALMSLNSDDLVPFIEEHNINPVRAYNLSKEAVIVLTMRKTQELLEHDIRINSVSPAAVNTGILQDFTDAFGDKVRQNIARVGRAGEPEEVARVIVFLASKDSYWIKGQNITIDGGMSAITDSDTMGL